MKKKLLIVIIIFLLFITGCKDDDNTDLPIEPILANIEIESLPEKLDYYYDEALDLTGLKVLNVFDNNVKTECSDYEIKYNDFEIGKNTITITKEDKMISFDINVHNYNRETIKGHLNYNNKTIISLDITIPQRILYDVKKGGNRTKDTLVVYSKENYQKTNIYGYEVAVNKYGRVINKGINVDLPEDGLILSGHGARVNELKEIKLNQIIIYNVNILIFEDDNITIANDLFLCFNETVELINNIKDIKEYNSFVYRINALIPSIDRIYNEYDETTTIKLIKEMEKIKSDIGEYEWINHKHSYTSCNINCAEKEDSFKGISLLTDVLTYDGELLYGGFRDTDKLVYYDNDKYYHSRNEYGYEVAVNDEGIVTKMDVLVDIPENGFVLSGHGVMNDYLVKNIRLGDYVTITNGVINVKRDVSKERYYHYLLIRNEIINSIKYELDNNKNHDYVFINEILKETDRLIDGLGGLNNAWSIISQFRVYNKLDVYLPLLQAQLLDDDKIIDKGIWYYPFAISGRDETIENVVASLLELKEMGITELLVSPFYKEKSIYNSSIYKSMEYGDEYGEYKDYLSCLIGEAHKLGIKINLFTATFASYVNVMKTPIEEYYQINYQGERSLGNINYYDICNDNVQNMLMEWYKELVTNYDVDSIEYDIIRFPDSNLHNYLDIDVIPSNKKITDHGYTEYSMNKFMNKYGYSGDLKELIRTDKKIRNEWFKFKTDNVNEFVKKTSEMMRSIKSDLTITAAVYSEWERAIKSVHQDYHLWLDEGWIDKAEPMCYTNSISKYIDELSYNYVEGYTDKVRMGTSVRLTENNLYKDFQEMKISENYNGYILFSSSYYLKDKTFIDIMKVSHHEK